MELLNFTSNGCRFIYNGKISKLFNIVGNERQVVESKTALVIDTTIKYEVRESIDNDTIKSISIINLDQFYEDNLLKFDYCLLYKTIMNALNIDAIHSNELSFNVNELLNKEYFINKTKHRGGIVILVKTEDDEGYIGIYDDDAIKVADNGKLGPIEFTKNILERDDIVKVECTKVNDIYSIINDIAIYNDFGLIYYKSTRFINNFVPYTTLDDIVFDITSFDNHLSITVKKDLEEERKYNEKEEKIKWYSGDEFPELDGDNSIHILVEFKSYSDVMARNVIGDFYSPERLEGPYACLKCDDKVVNFENKKDFASRVKRWRYMG